MITIKRGLNIPLAGEPQRRIKNAKPVRSVALVGDDYIGMKPTMEVREGDAVKLGQVLFTDKKTEGVKFTSPGSGKVAAINRGAKRKFESVVIELDGDEQVTFQTYQDTDLAGVPREQIRANLIDAGLWTAFRQRPFSKVPAITAEPAALFVQAIDTNPLAAPPELVLAEYKDYFIAGLHALRSVLNVDGGTKIYLCTLPGASIPGRELDFVKTEEFSGPHPAGLPGTHMHYLCPVGPRRSAWHIYYQDVVAIGHLLLTGKLFTDRVISLAGPEVSNPRLLRTRLGANITELLDGEVPAERLNDKSVRVISGSVLSGRNAIEPWNYVGRFHHQICVIKEGLEREFLGWQMPGANKFSVKRAFASGWLGSRRFAMTTNTGGSPRAMVPIGSYEQVMPLDILPTQLLRSLIVGDTEQAQALGCLELDEDDLALCTFVCPGKYDYGPLLRLALSEIEREG